MQQKVFSRIDTLTGWLIFVIAAVIYCLTVEPTASLWDCPEFIACGYKLEIGHPPGAPFYMLVANFFSQMASDPSQVAWMINILSALLSAGCILFLFWTITHLARQLYGGHELLDLPKIVVIEACGVVGALVYTFSDSFWFSAVESEVYAFSSFLTALVFWLILRWEEEADHPQSDRWLILTAYMIGLSVGVHLLCLLCLPAMVLVVYGRKTKQLTWWSALKALLVGGVLLAMVLYMIIPGVLRLGSWMELLFVNVLHLPYLSGLIFAVILLFAMMFLALMKAKRRVIRTSLQCLIFFLVGLSSYAVIIIRSSAQPPMDENSPDHVFALRSYMSREQYGDTPLLYGPAYCSELDYEPQGEYQVAKVEEGAPVYQRSSDSAQQRYEVVHRQQRYVYRDNMWFPRMHSQLHTNAYEQWMGGVKKRNGVPTTSENLRFFWSYQVCHMYWRYFLWNFVGRQNNIKGNGEVEHGNWITGLRLIDDFLLGCDTSKLPSDLSSNKGRNVYYAIPLLMGLLGGCWQWRRGTRGRWQLVVVLSLFLMTGLAIVVYLNQPPQPPRERDYVFVGSFYAFAIWIGMGVAALDTLLRRLTAKPLWTATVSSALCMLIPFQMVSQTWDDHNRSGRYACRDFGLNYLESMQREGHPIILTNGDNDTFPLWYNHEVEGKRLDTRDCNLSYVQTDWYIDQMRRPAYDSPPLPINWRRKDYQEGNNEVVPIRPELKQQVLDLYHEQPEEARRMFGDQPFELSNIIHHWVLNDNPELKVIPTDSVTITTGAEQMVISFAGRRMLYKKDLVVLEMLSHGDWSRPIYASISLGPDEVPYLSDHLSLEGMAYRIVPTSGGRRVDVERTYENVMHRFHYGGLSRRGLYVDDDVLYTAHTHQYVMAILIDSLLEQGDTQRALAVADKWQRELPAYNVPYTESALSLARCYYVTGNAQEGDKIVDNLLRRSHEWLSWLQTIKPSRSAGSAYSFQKWSQIMQGASSLALLYHRDHLLKNHQKDSSI